MAAHFYWVTLAASIIASVVFIVMPKDRGGDVPGLGRAIGLLFTFAVLGTLIVGGLIPRILYQRRGADVAVTVIILLLLVVAVFSFLFVTCRVAVGDL